MLRCTRPCPAVLLLSLDRPDVHNALNAALVDALHEQLAATAADATVRAVVLGSSTPGKFCAGADLAVPDAERRKVSDDLYGLYEKMLTLPIPVVAAVDGAAVGGGSQLALAADVRLGSPQARFRFVGPGHGLSVGPWGLPSTIGRRALELVLSQRFVDAEESVAIGLLDRLAEDPLRAAVELADSVARLDGDAVRRAKQQVVEGERLLARLAEERSANAAVFTGEVRRGN
ncbi:enoyl-CoA hydratase/isomerase family protein [Saccharopolyspora phatthalungensis]|uniref:Enoyl-CoA hydratase/carnithine racemase n=1 Tax=Saccharopolyspora phatthalungensis TaxID=664693 RepID=A0A840Q5L1_9PSEU|nr:enoyl-CoA hydratase/isomerase family protein [Saccharopolyspora phatthalungensis]MBB5157792.1 enoyl-CoA hydratase/carnithine racemase [Saccharopolyspora phatthalungensis]